MLDSDICLNRSLKYSGIRETVLEGEGVIETPVSNGGRRIREYWQYSKLFEDSRVWEIRTRQRRNIRRSI